MNGVKRKGQEKRIKQGLKKRKERMGFEALPQIKIYHYTTGAHIPSW